MNSKTDFIYPESNLNRNFYLKKADPEEEPVTNIGGIYVKKDPKLIKENLELSYKQEKEIIINTQKYVFGLEKDPFEGRGSSSQPCEGKEKNLREYFHLDWSGIKFYPIALLNGGYNSNKEFLERILGDLPDIKRFYIEWYIYPTANPEIFRIEGFLPEKNYSHFLNESESPFEYFTETINTCKDFMRKLFMGSGFEVLPEDNHGYQ